VNNDPTDGFDRVTLCVDGDGTEVRNNWDGTGKLHRGAGCRKCRGTGYFGRSGLFELMLTTERVRENMRERAKSGLWSGGLVAAAAVNVIDGGRGGDEGVHPGQACADAPAGLVGDDPRGLRHGGANVLYRRSPRCAARWII
jgi:hypothetical protein